MNSPESYSETWKTLFFIRFLSIEGDTLKALQALDSVKVYPLAKAGEPIIYHFVDVTDAALSNKLLAWEDKLDYWKELKAVVEAETAPAEFRPMLGMLQSLGIEKGMPFNPDARTTSILEEATNKALAEMRVNAYANRKPERLVWSDRNWDMA